MNHELSFFKQLHIIDKSSCLRIYFFCVLKIFLKRIEIYLFIYFKLIFFDVFILG